MEVIHCEAKEEMIKHCIIKVVLRIVEVAHDLKAKFSGIFNISLNILQRTILRSFPNFYILSYPLRQSYQHQGQFSRPVHVIVHFIDGVQPSYSDHPSQSSGNTLRRHI